MAPPFSNAATPQQQQQQTTRCYLHDSVTPPSGGGAADITSKLRPDMRRALADVTNDSPIIGLSFPATKLDCTRFSSQGGGTPGGEDALRSQVKLLLQKVENEIHKAPSLRTLSHINGFLSSPSRLAAPTPTNTPATSTQTASPTTPIIAAPSPRRIPFVNGLDHTSFPIYLDQTITKPEIGTPLLKWSSEKKSAQNAESVCPQQINSGISTIFEPTESTPIQEVIDAREVVGAEHLGNPITRALQFESPEKSATEITMSSAGAPESCDSSPGRNTRDNVEDDDDTSDWSVLVNVSPHGRSPGRLPDEISDFTLGGNNEGDPARTTFQLKSPNEEEGYKLEFIWDQGDPYSNEDEVEYEDCEDRESCLGKEEDQKEEEEYYEEVFGQQVDIYEELCNGLSRMNVDDKKGLPEFKGKHVRFVYNSDDEIEGEEVVTEPVYKENEPQSEGVVRLKGMPTSVGKHLRFPEEEDEGNSGSSSAI